MKRRILLTILAFGLVGILLSQIFLRQAPDIHSDMYASAHDILQDNQDADIFKYNDQIYMNVESMDHIATDHFKKGKQIAHISEQSVDARVFKNGTATKLPQGTKIYQTVGEGLSILTVEKDEQYIIYMALLDDRYFQE